MTKVLCHSNPLESPVFRSDYGDLQSIRDLDKLCRGELLEKALETVNVLHLQGLPLPREIAYSLLLGCTKRKDLHAGRRLHSLMVSSGLDSIASLADHLIRIFALCGSLLEANLVFKKVAKRTVYTWQAIISAHATHGKSEKALELCTRMQEEGVRPGKFVFLSVLKACGNVGAVHQGRLIHSKIIGSGLESDLIIGSTLINMYAQCGSLEEARAQFDSLSIMDVVLWNAMIAGYAQHGHGLPAVELSEKMQQQGIKPDKVTYLCLLKACGTTAFIRQGELIHDQIIRRQLDSGVVIGNTLLDMYAKCGRLDEAQKVFDNLSGQNVVSWNALIAAHVQRGHNGRALELFEKLQQTEIKPDKVTFLAVLQACGRMRATEHGQLIHDQLIRSGLGSDVSLKNTLIDMYARCGNLDLARELFEDLSSRDMVSWGVMIAGYAEHGCGLLALLLFERMQLVDIKPGKVVLMCILKACTSIGAVMEGQLIHNDIIRSGLESDAVVGSTLVDMYAKCGNLEEAREVFDRLPSRDVVSCSAMIAGYARHGDVCALELFEKMQQEGMKLDQVTILCLLKACGNLKAIGQGKLIHHHILGSEFVSDVVMGSTLVDMYIKCGNLEEARGVFDGMVIRNEVTWSAMIAGYVQHEHSLPALELFAKMQQEGFKSDDVMFLGILKACGSVGAAEYGMLVHGQIVEKGLASDGAVGNTIVDMYARCGCVEEASDVFKKLANQDVVSWNAMIAAYAQQGHYQLVWQCLEDMQQNGINPVGRTYTSILAACCHAGQVEDCHKHFKSMTEDHGITPSVEHFNCMIDMLGRAGRLGEAQQLIQTMPIPPDTTGWVSLLAACRTYRSVELGRHCFDELVKLDPNIATGFVLMSDIYADAHRWEDVNKIQELRKCISAWKKPGAAWIECQNVLHAFMVGDRNHPENDNIHAKLNRLKRVVKEGGYVAQLSLVSEIISNEHTKDVFGWAQ